MAYSMTRKWVMKDGNVVIHVTVAKHIAKLNDIREEAIHVTSKLGNPEKNHFKIPALVCIC